MTMPKTYKKRSMAELEDEAVRILGLFGARGIRCGALGSHLFKDSIGAVNCSCPHARIAGKVVRRLRDKGLADDSARAGGWVLTTAGRERLKELNGVAER